MKALISKPTIFILILSIYLFSSCEDWELSGIKGYGPIETDIIEVGQVNGLELDIPAKVYLKQGDEQFISIEAQGNILDNIERSNRNGKLKLKFDRNVNKCEQIVVYMTIRDLNEINIAGSGCVISDTPFVTEGNMYINLSGSGYIELNAIANEISLNIAGSGEIKLSATCERLYGNISGSGKISITEGISTYSEYKISGSGNIYAYNFLVEQCYVNTAGSGNAKVNVSDYLNVKIAGSGDVFYKGNPSVTVNISGSGDVIKTN